MGEADAAPSALDTSAEVRSIAATLLPGMPLLARGVSHVAAGVERRGRLEPFRVAHPAAPKSRWDRILLDLSRLRAEAIVITGSILRDEPELRYDFDPAWAEAFTSARGELGIRERPLLVVLTRAGVDASHPVFDSPVDPLVLRDARSPSEAIDAAWSRGARSISVEAGPSVAAQLYEAGTVDELLFHRFDVALPEDALVGAFVDESRVRELFGPPRSVVPVRDGAIRSSIERFSLPLPRGH